MLDHFQVPLAKTTLETSEVDFTISHFGFRNFDEAIAETTAISHGVIPDLKQKIRNDRYNLLKLTVVFGYYSH